MSYYGPPGEPNRPQPEDYGPPSDPWGTAPAVDGWSAYDNPPYANQANPDSPYSPYQEGPAGQRGGPGEQEDSWAPPPPPLPPPRRSSGLYVLVAVLVVLAASGVGYALYLLSAENGDGQADDPTAPPSVTTTPSGSAAPSTAPPDNIGLNAATAQVDDCLINDGTSEQPQMRVVRCDGDEEGQVFQILAIFEEQVEGEGTAANEQAQEICADTEGYRYHYYEVSDNASFVLCMTDRDA